MVVSPDDIKRLTKIVQRVLDLTTIEEPVSKPVVDKFANDQYPNLQSRWVVPIVYDRKTLFKNAEPVELENQHTIRYAKWKDFFAAEISTFSHPARQSRNRRKPFNTRLLHDFTRLAFENVSSPDLVSKELRRPVKNFIREPDGSLVPGQFPAIPHPHENLCATSERPASEYVILDRLPVFRLATNIPFSKLHEVGDNAAAAALEIAPRSASGPALTPLFDEASDTFGAFGEAFPGEVLSLIGWVILPRPTNRPLSTSQVPEACDLSTAAVFHGVSPALVAAVDADKPAVVYSQDVQNVLDAVIPDDMGVLARHADELDAAYNADHIDNILTHYAKTFKDLSHDAVSVVRGVMTRNIVEYIEAMSNLEASPPHTLSTPQRAADGGRLPEFLSADLLRSVYEVSPDATAPVQEVFRWLLRRPDGGAAAVTKYSESVGAAEAPIPASKLLPRAGADVDVDLSHASVIVELAETLSKSPAEFLSRTRGLYTARRNQSGHALLKHAAEVDGDANFSDRRVALALHSALGYVLQTRARHNVLKRPLDAVQGLEAFRVSEKEKGGDDPNALYEIFDSTGYTAVAAALVNVSPLPNPSKLFRTQPLVLIGNQLVVMMATEKLNFVMSADDLINCVYDISEMCDELPPVKTFVIDKLSQPDPEGGSIPDRIAEARRAHRIEFGGEMQVKANARVATLLARLLIQLETHRPKYAFKTLFALSGRKTIGSNDDTDYIMYTDDNKIDFIVRVASKPSGLGDRGILLEGTQADNVAHVIALTADKYDRFRTLRRVRQLYDDAAASDARLTAVQEDKIGRAQTGFKMLTEADGTASGPTTKKMLHRLEAYNLSTAALRSRVGHIHDSFDELLSVRAVLSRSLRFYIAKDLVQKQRAVEEDANNDAGYNPGLWGDAKTENNCSPEFPCMKNTSIDMNDVSSEYTTRARDISAVLRRLRLPCTALSFARLPVPCHAPSDFSRIFTEVAAGDCTAYLHNLRSRGVLVASADGGSHDDCKTYWRYILNHRTADVTAFARHRIHPESSMPAGFDVVTPLNQLGQLLATQLRRSRTWSDTFLAVVSSFPNPKGPTFLRNVNCELRKHVTLLKQGLRVRMNRYTFVRSELDIESYKKRTTIRTRVVDPKHTKPNDVFLLSNSDVQYLLPFAPLREIFGHHRFKFSSSATSASQTITDKARSAKYVKKFRKHNDWLLYVLITELTALIDDVDVEEGGEDYRSMVCSFVDAFIDRCRVLHQFAGLKVEDLEDFVQHVEEVEMIKAMSRTKTEQSDYKALRILEDFGDTAADAGWDFSDGHDQTEGLGFDYVDEENKMNLEDNV